MAPSNIIAELAKEFISDNTEDVVDIITFAEAPWGLNLDLYPSQRFTLKCLYGLPLDNTVKDIPVPDMMNDKILYTFTEKEFLQWMFDEGRCNTNETEGKSFQELVLSIGRRGGKSALASFISSYELHKLVKRGDPAAFYKHQPGSKSFILNVAPTDDQAGIVFDMIQQQAAECPYLRDRILHKTMTYFDLQVDSDLKNLVNKKRASVVALAGGCSSNGLRGRNAIIVIMDEMAFFIDNAGRFSGSQVYDALTPSTASFGYDGKTICISSPYAKFGKFYGRWLDSFHETDTTLAFKMYTALANPTIKPEYLKAKRRQNRVSFMCEFGAEFSDAVTAWVDDEAEFRRCITRNDSPGRGIPDVKYFMGIDLGFKNDGTAVAIVHREEKTRKIIVDHADVWFSGSSDVWDFEESIYKNCTKYSHLDLLKMEYIISEIKELARWFSIKGGIFDQSNGYALQELLGKERLKQIVMENFTDKINHEVYELTKRMYAEQLLDLYDHPVLVPEILTLEAERKAKNRILVRAPARRGAHDDISDAVSRAVWLCYKTHKQRSPNLVTGAGGMGGHGVSHHGPQELRVKTQTQASFFVDRRKRHGDHPRDKNRLKRRMPGAVR